MREAKLLMDKWDIEPNLYEKNTFKHNAEGLYGNGQLSKDFGATLSTIGENAVIDLGHIGDRKKKKHVI